MQNIHWKLLLIIGILAVCLLSIFTSEPRLGRDLRGGVSLVYQVSIPEDANAADTLTQTIEVLKDRVNPRGVLDISMEPMGRDRIEVVMPLPDEEVRALSQQFDQALGELLAKSEIHRPDLDEALRAGEAPSRIGGDASTERGAKVLALQEAYDERAAARDELEALDPETADEAELRAARLRVADAEIAFEDLYNDVLGLSLGEATVRRVLALPDEKINRVDEAGDLVRDEDGQIILEPSQRETALQALIVEYPQLEEELQRVVAAYDAYQGARTGFDDPEDLKRLLRGAGVLEFHIAVDPADEESGVQVDELRNQLMEVGPEGVVSGAARWFPINEIEQWYDNEDQLAMLEADPVTYFAQMRGLAAAERDGVYYLLLYMTDAKSLAHDTNSNWSITGTGRGIDQLGRPAVTFQLNQSGGTRMSRLTSGSLGEPMAIVLDGQVFSAPNIQSTIASQGQITGNFSELEINYLIRVLAAGALSARLSPEPIAMNTLGPSLGAENLTKAKWAFIISIIAVAAFMIFYYLFAGIVAVIALAANGVIIFGVMFGIDATFTLPGLAGIVLTIGMAVDANVLIYERIREEMFDGELDLRGCVRQGYAKALSTIFDANITNLIVCFVLFKTATTEVKGFAYTLTIGICATLFTALFVTRQIFYLYTDAMKQDRLPMLPTVFPAVHRALEPSINWIGLRKFFWVASFAAVVLSVAAVYSRGVDMFDTELRGGVSLTMRTARTNGDDRLLLRHTGDGDAVLERVHNIGESVEIDPNAPQDEQTRQLILRELANAAVLTAGDTVTRDGAVLASAFQVKVASPKGIQDDATITETIVDAIVDEFEDQLDVTPPLDFDGARSEDAAVEYAFPIESPELGANIGRPGATQSVADYLGGVAILLTNIDPPATLDDVEKRIDRMRNQPDYAQYSGRAVEVFGIEPADPSNPQAGYSEIAVVVSDPYRSYLVIDSDVWFEEVASTEWNLVSTALTRQTSLEQVSSFSSAVAATLSANAVVAVVLTLLGILVYIWVRFGSLRYSLAAIVALVHDVSISLGLLALTSIIGNSAIAATIGIEPFRIDLGVVAALLTIIGYSLNDTIVILDRVRENKGKRPLPTPGIVNLSINQTVSRTLLTSVTTLMAVLIMYIEGGSGIRPFTFVLLTGLIVGTYSSVAVAGPLVVKGGGGGAEDETFSPAEYRRRRFGGGDEPSPSPTS